MGTSAGREAWRIINDLMFDGEAHGRLQDVCATSGMPPGLVKTLIHLRPDDGIQMRELAEHYGVDPSYVTGLTDKLEERGLVERRPHPGDRRVKTIALTDAGVRIRDRFFELLYNPPPSFDVLSAEEQRQLRDLLRRVAAADPELARGGIHRR